MGSGEDVIGTEGCSSGLQILSDRWMTDVDSDLIHTGALPTPC